MLPLSPAKHETKKERIAKLLMHTEDELLTLLKGERGVVKKHEFFSEMCLHEEVRRIILITTVLVNLNATRGLLRLLYKASQTDLV